MKHKCCSLSQCWIHASKSADMSSDLSTSTKRARLIIVKYKLNCIMLHYVAWQPFKHKIMGIPLFSQRSGNDYWWIVNIRNCFKKQLGLTLSLWPWVRITDGHEWKCYKRLKQSKVCVLSFGFIFWKTYSLFSTPC